MQRNPIGDLGLESGQLDERVEPREQILRVAEIAPFPRNSTNDVPSTGFALDESESGLCLQLEAPVPVGVLLRITLRDFDGLTKREEIVRVAWCRARSGGRYNAGLEVAEETAEQRLCVQHAVRRSEIDIGRND